MAKPTTGDRLNATRAELDAVNRQIAETDTKRNAALLADDDRAARGHAGKLDDLRAQARGLQDKIALLEGEIAREEQERRVKERTARIEKVKHMFAERDAAVAKLAEVVKQADTVFRDVTRLGRDINAAWPWQSHDAAACLLPPGAILIALKHEIFRVGSRPHLFGGQRGPVDAGLDFPGGQSPRIELRGTPAAVPSMVDVFKQATDCAVEILRTGKSTSGHAAPAPVDGVPSFMLKEPPPLTPAQQRLRELLSEQVRLANDMSPAGEAKYAALMKEIAAAEVEAGVMIGVAPAAQGAKQ